MKLLKRKIGANHLLLVPILVVVTIAIIGSSCITGYAIAGGGARYSDVDKDAWYYNAVETMAVDGIILGYEDGSFKPESYVTVDEMQVLLGRAFGSTASTEYMWSDSWLSYYKGNGLVTRAMAAKMLLNSLKMPSVNISAYNTTELLDIDTCGSGLKSEVVSCFLLGYIKGDGTGYVNHSDYLTRAQACTIIYRAKYELLNVTYPEKDYANPVKVNAYEFEDSFVKDTAVQQVTVALQNVPDVVSEAFTYYGYKLQVCPTAAIVKEFDGNPATVAITSYAKQRIIIGANTNGTITSRSVEHEAGHYVLVKWGNSSTVKKLFGLEATALSKITGTSYCTVNSSEFFAEAFSIYCTDKAKLAAECPKAYEYIDTLIKGIDYTQHITA